jgi:prepilin-type N-terminal cleavage/methylation domain-containing protein
MPAKRALRRGMTLVELLAVVAIMVILMSLAIQVMRPGLKDRKLREASRQINTFFALAKARAAESGRPWGVAIMPNPTVTGSSYQLFLAETPPPFAGEMLGDKATLSLPDPMNNPHIGQATFNDTYQLTQPGDYIQFDYKGPKYQITSASGTAPRTVIFQAASGQPMPYISEDTMNAPTRLPFQVYRSPILSNANPLQLPTGTVIDLTSSGIGQSGTEMAATTTLPPIIMFHPSGSVDRLLNVSFTAPGTIHLLVGRVDKVPTLEPDTTKQNLTDPTASWVSIGYLTGTVTTAENVVPGDLSAMSVSMGRSIAQSKQTMGGR